MKKTHQARLTTSQLRILGLNPSLVTRKVLLPPQKIYSSTYQSW